MSDIFVFLILVGAWSLVRWNKAMKAASAIDRVLTGVLGPFALLTKRSGGVHDRKHLARFYLSMIFFIGWNTIIALLAKSLAQ